MRLVGISAFGSVLGLVLASQASAAVLYDGNGFEPSFNASKNFSRGNGLGQSLVGQPAAAADKWAQDSGTAATITATVLPYAIPTGGNTQYVSVATSLTGAGADDYGFFYPQTFTGANAYTPVANQKIAITWTMANLVTGGGSPFFGIDAYGSGVEIARFGIDGTTGGLVVNGSDTVDATFTATPGVFYQYELLLDYTAQTYAVYTAPADNATAFVLRGGGSFLNSATTFTDADIATFGLAGTDFSGVAAFDNYSVQTQVVPEPALAGVAGLALGLLARRRSRTGV